jgi:L-asparaginase
MTSAVNEEVHFIITGGTIDSAYHGDFDTIEPGEKSVIPQYIARVKLARPACFTQVCMKDSRRLTTQDRQEIAGVITRSSAQKFIVTHGTYTLPETAQFLQSHLGATEKVVILTSSTIPLEGVTMSNGGFNLGFAYAQLEVLNPGVHVCTNGQIFSPDELVKLLNEGRFTTIFSGLPETSPE